MNKSYFNDIDQLHRLAGPAITWDSGLKEWWVNGDRHRVDGPAIEYNDGIVSWYMFGNRLNTFEVEQWLKDNNLSYPFNKETQFLFQLRFL